MKSLSWLVALLVCSAALAGAQTEQGAEVLLRADRDFARATQERGAEGWAEYMADSAVLGHARPVVGKEAILASMKEFFAGGKASLKWQPTHGELFKAGDLGYTTGRYQMSGEDGQGNKVTREGTYLTVWKMVGDSWKVIYDTGSPDPPPSTKSKKP